MIRFVEDPVSVQVPPRIQANDRGISSLDDLSSEDLASDSTIGKNTTTTGVLLTNAEYGADNHYGDECSNFSLTGQLFKSSSKERIQPLFSRPALITNMQAIVSGAG